MTQHVRLGDELTVSALGFGAMALTPVYGNVDDTESLATLNRCRRPRCHLHRHRQRRTAAASNEQLIAKLLADRRDEVTLATKFGITGSAARTVPPAS